MTRENKYVLRQGADVVAMLGTEIGPAAREVTQCVGLSGGCEYCVRTEERRQMIAARKERHG